MSVWVQGSTAEREEGKQSVELADTLQAGKWNKQLKHAVRSSIWNEKTLAHTDTVSVKRNVFVLNGQQQYCVCIEAKRRL